MSDAKSTFEAIMRIEGKDKLIFKSGKYLDPSMQVRWRWFQTGWEMKGLMK